MLCHRDCESHRLLAGKCYVFFLLYIDRRYFDFLAFMNTASFMPTNAPSSRTTSFGRPRIALFMQSLMVHISGSSSHRQKTRRWTQKSPLRSQGTSPSRRQHLHPLSGQQSVRLLPQDQEEKETAVLFSNIPYNFMRKLARLHCAHWSQRTGKLHQSMLLGTNFHSPQRDRHYHLQIRDQPAGSTEETLTP